MALTAAEVYRDYSSDGIPSSGVHEPKKSEIRTLLGQYEQIITAFTSNGGLIYSSKAAMDADLAHDAKSSAWVVGDATAANNGIYQKQGSSGSGSWTRVADLPYSFIVASDVGAGTPDAIVATSSLPVSGSALVLINVNETNTGSPVTVSFNGGTPLTVKTNSGNDVAPGGLISGMLVMGRVSGSTFRLVSDQTSAAILAQAESAALEAMGYRDSAAGYAAIALKNWFADAFVGDGTADPLTLTAGPGSVYNCIITVEGEGPQPSGIFTLDGMNLYPPDGAVWPNGKKIEVRYGTAFDAGVPSPGSVDRTAMANDAVGPDELDADAVQAQHIDAAEASGIRDKLGLGEDDTPNFAGLEIGGVPVSLGSTVTFSASKNGVNQTGVTTDVKLTFGTEDWDVGGYYDAANSRFTPPAGKYELTVAAYFSAGIADQEELVVYVYKNGTSHRWASVRTSGVGAIGNRVSAIVDANGTDYFEAFATVTGSAKTVSGNAAATYFQGRAI